MSGGVPRLVSRPRKKRTKLYLPRGLPLSVWLPKSRNGFVAGLLPLALPEDATCSVKGRAPVGIPTRSAPLPERGPRVEAPHRPGRRPPPPSHPPRLFIPLADDRLATPGRGPIGARVRADGPAPVRMAPFTMYMVLRRRPMTSPWTSLADSRAVRRRDRDRNSPPRARPLAPPSPRSFRRWSWSRDPILHEWPCRRGESTGRRSPGVLPRRDRGRGPSPPDDNAPPKRQRPEDRSRPGRPPQPRLPAPAARRSSNGHNLGRSWLA